MVQTLLIIVITYNGRAKFREIKKHEKKLFMFGYFLYCIIRIQKLPYAGIILQVQRVGYKILSAVAPPAVICFSSL